MVADFGDGDSIVEREAIETSLAPYSPLLGRSRCHVVSLEMKGRKLWDEGITGGRLSERFGADIIIFDSFYLKCKYKLL